MVYLSTANNLLNLCTECLQINTFECKFDEINLFKIFFCMVKEIKFRRKYKQKSIPILWRRVLRNFLKYLRVFFNFSICVSINVNVLNMISDEFLVSIYDFCLIVNTFQIRFVKTNNKVEE